MQPAVPAHVLAARTTELHWARRDAAQAFAAYTEVYLRYRQAFAAYQENSTDAAWKDVQAAVADVETADTWVAHATIHMERLSKDLWDPRLGPGETAEHTPDASAAPSTDAPEIPNGEEPGPS